MVKSSSDLSQGLPRRRPPPGLVERDRTDRLPPGKLSTLPLVLEFGRVYVEFGAGRGASPALAKSDSRCYVWSSVRAAGALDIVSGANGTSDRDCGHFAERGEFHA